MEEAIGHGHVEQRGREDHGSSPSLTEHGGLAKHLSKIYKNNVYQHKCNIVIFFNLLSLKEQNLRISF